MFKTDSEENFVVRGCERRIYHVKNTESEIFDEAYFVLKRQERGRAISPRELEREALRIVNCAVATEPIPIVPCRKKERLRAYVAGALSSSVIIAFISLVLWLTL